MNNSISKEEELHTSIETCRKKKTFGTYRAAQKAAKRRNAKEHYSWTRSYKCDNCQLWHHTTKKEQTNNE